MDQSYEDEPEQRRAYANGSGKPIDDDLSHRVEEAFDIWRHVWPFAKFGVPLTVTLIVAAYGSGFVQVPFAKQRQVDEIGVAQKIQNETVHELKSGMTEIHGALIKLTEKISDMNADVRETRAEMRSLYQPQTPFVVTTQDPPSPLVEQPQAKPQAHKAPRAQVPKKQESGIGSWLR
jgi:hypothetical protein